VGDRPVELLETIRFSPAGEGFLLADHLDRMASSARMLGYAFDREPARRAADEAAASLAGAARVRLLSSPDGRVRAEASPLPSSAGTVRVRVATDPVDPHDVRLRHKTVDRDIYQRRLQAAGPCDDVILINTAGELTESTIANLALVIGGVAWTPPVDAGLLPGVFRADLLRRGRLRERRLRPADLLVAEAVYLINSVRLWRRALLLR
jgi:para-aminobenzoate synthetase / 4-amino-4-deoxychorismate lyase